MGEISYPADADLTDRELQAFQLLADGVNLLGKVHRRKIKRARWHRVSFRVRWEGPKTLRVEDLVMREDR